MIAFAFAAQFAVWIASRLFGFVVAVFDEGFGVILFDPGDDVLGVERDSLPKFRCVGTECGLEQPALCLSHALMQRLRGSSGARVRHSGRGGSKTPIRLLPVTGDFRWQKSPVGLS